jgi:hypothetical protein
MLFGKNLKRLRREFGALSVHRTEPDKNEPVTLESLPAAR